MYFLLYFVFFVMFVSYCNFVIFVIFDICNVCNFCISICTTSLFCQVVIMSARRWWECKYRQLSRSDYNQQIRHHHCHHHHRRQCWYHQTRPSLHNILKTFLPKACCDFYDKGVCMFPGCRPQKPQNMCYIISHSCHPAHLPRTASWSLQILFVLTANEVT